MLHENLTTSHPLGSSMFFKITGRKVDSNPTAMASVSNVASEGQLCNRVRSKFKGSQVARFANAVKALQHCMGQFRLGASPSVDRPR
jgi:hypothetical protein